MPWVTQTGCPSTLAYQHGCGAGLNGLVYNQCVLPYCLDAELMWIRWSCSICLLMGRLEPEAAHCQFLNGLLDLGFEEMSRFSSMHALCTNGQVDTVCAIDATTQGRQGEYLQFMTK